MITILLYIVLNALLENSTKTDYKCGKITNLEKKLNKFQHYLLTIKAQRYENFSIKAQSFQTFRSASLSRVCDVCLCGVRAMSTFCVLFGNNSFTCLYWNVPNRACSVHVETAKSFSFISFQFSRHCVEPESLKMHRQTTLVVVVAAIVYTYYDTFVVWNIGQTIDPTNQIPLDSR